MITVITIKHFIQNNFNEVYFLIYFINKFKISINWHFSRLQDVDYFQ